MSLRPVWLILLFVPTIALAQESIKTSRFTNFKEPLAAAKVPDDKTKKPKDAPRPEVVRQGFPVLKANENDLKKSETAWEIEWDFAPVGKTTVFRIVSATFLWKDAKGNSRSLTVARNLQLMEAFSQYDNGDGVKVTGTCWLDIAKVGLSHVPGNKKFLGPSCIGEGKLLESKTAEFNKKVYKELHYDGLRWIKIYGGYDARKGEKLSLWSAIASGNYVYIMEYDFTDDGRIVTRLGFTAHNYFNRAKIGDDVFQTNDLDVHMHIGCWRMDLELYDPVKKQGGSDHNDLSIVRRVFDSTAKKFHQDKAPFPGDAKAIKENASHEGKAKWVAKNFTVLRAESQLVKNSRGLPIAYDLITTRTGTAEDLMPIHQAKGLNMDFVNYDYWVTCTPAPSKHYYQLPDMAAGQQKLKGHTTTVWHSVPIMHVPRDEDFGVGGVDANKGVALTEWTSFTLRPRNMFDSTPLFP
jgi:Copper amine oxidase, enzyme domain